MNDAANASKSQEIPTLSTSLLGQIRGMDAAGWSRLVITFGPIVYRWCRRAGIREADAADVVQEVFATVARGIQGFERQKEVGSFRSWLVTITRSRVRDHLRRQARHLHPVGGSDALDQLNQVPDNSLTDDLDSSISADDIQSSLARRVMTILKSEFEPVTWQAFVMTTLDGLSPAMVAERLQLSLASVYQARTRVLRKLRQRLAEF